MRVVTFKIDEDLLQQLDVLAINQRLSRSDIIREAIEFYLKRINNHRAWTREI